MTEGDARVPAGWYPDPLGLPQLRWWDNQAWTEHVSEARQPMVAQETIVQSARLSFADAEPLPEEDTRGDDLVPAGSVPMADTLLQLEAPALKTLVAPEPAAEAPEQKFSEFVPADLADDTIAGRFDDLLVDERWSPPTTLAPEPEASAPFTIPSVPFTMPADVRPAEPVVDRAPAPAAAPAGATDARPRGLRTWTVQAWIIAVSPLTFIVVSLVLLTAGGLDVSGAAVVALSLALPYLGCIPLAFGDWLVSRRRGLRPPHWLWIMATPVVYLIVRAIVLTRRNGRGFGPLLGLAGSLLTGFAAILLVPGILISVNPLAFSHAIEQSVRDQASAFGVSVTASCPPNPPTVVGDDFTCMVHESGDTVNGWDVRVSLQRANGWISWHVDDWGELASAHAGMRAAG